MEGPVSVDRGLVTHCYVSSNIQKGPEEPLIHIVMRCSSFLLHLNKVFVLFLTLTCITGRFSSKSILDLMQETDIFF